MGYLMEWIVTRDEDQMVDDAVVMMDNMEMVLKENDYIASVVMENILVEAAEVLIEIIQIRNKKVEAYDMMCGEDELGKVQHHFDKITLGHF